MFIQPNNFRYTDGKTNFDIKMDLMWIDSLTWDSYAYSLIMRKRCNSPGTEDRSASKGLNPLGGAAGKLAQRESLLETP